MIGGIFERNFERRTRCVMIAQNFPYKQKKVRYDRRTIIFDVSLTFLFSIVLENFKSSRVLVVLIKISLKLVLIVNNLKQSDSTCSRKFRNLVKVSFNQCNYINSELNQKF